MIAIGSREERLGQELANLCTSRVTRCFPIANRLRGVADALQKGNLTSDEYSELEEELSTYLVAVMRIRDYMEKAELKTF